MTQCSTALGQVPLVTLSPERLRTARTRTSGYWPASLVRRALPAAGLSAALFAAGWAGNTACAETPTLSSSLSAVAQGTVADPRQTPLVLAVQRAKTSVVNIHSVKTTYDEGSVFGKSSGRKVNGMGTGIVVDPRGYIVTNHHVVAGVESLRCTLVDGSTYEATTVATDPKHDLAIIKVTPTAPLTVMPLGTSSDLMLGETVVAVGNAFGYEHTVTAGIVSALGRNVEVNETQSYENLIQTDASINPGNSGGPLLNLRGEVVGINVAIRAGAQRIGFAIPIDDARVAIAELISTERLDRTSHGLQTQDIKAGIDRKLIVRGASAAGPAGRAGFHSGDIIVSANGQPVVDRTDLERSLLGRRSGQSVEVTVRRGTETLPLTLTLAPTSTGRDVVAAADPVTQPSAATDADAAWRVLGLRLTSGTAADVVGTSYEGGLRVSEVREGSPAAMQGIRSGDVLVGLHVWATVNMENVNWVLKQPDNRNLSPLKFFIVRGRDTLYGHLKLASR